MAYQIVRGSPVHCQITDAMIGSRYRVLPYVYNREDFARKLAATMHDRNYRDCGDDWFYVVEAGQPALNHLGRENRMHVVNTIDDNDSIPF